MSNSALSFISSRQNALAITEKRIESIVWYTIECYILLLKDKPKFSKQYVKDYTKFAFEDYLKMEFVDNYLVKYKRLLKNKISSLEEVNFSYETVKRYTDPSNVERPDKIDIYINKLGLKDYLKVEDEHLYFVYECKRIKKLSDTADYINDIHKFTDRKYAVLRLPFEGMIAFIENPSITHDAISKDVNKKLELTNTIKTNQNLTLRVFNPAFNGSYQSSHFKNFDNTTTFLIYHLLLDYSQNVV